MKKGMTLVELIIAMAILTILITGALTVINFKTLKNQIVVKNIQSDISSILTFGKQYAYKNQAKCNIKFNNKKNNVELIKSSNGNESIIGKIKLPKSYTIINEGMLKINEDGFIEASTITFTDVENNIYKVSIQVGNDIITIY